MNLRNSSEPPTCGAIAKSEATVVGPVRSRRRCVFGMPTTITGRIRPSRTRPSIVATTCGKSSSIPPSGMYRTGNRRPLATLASYSTGRWMLTSRDSPSTDDSTVNASSDAAGFAERVSPLELHEDGAHSTAQHKIAINPSPLEEAEITLSAVRPGSQ